MTTAQVGVASAEALITNHTRTSALEYLRELIPSRSPSPLPSPLSPLSIDTQDSAVAQVESRGPSPARSPFEDQPKINYMMAQPSGVTQEGLIRALKEKAGATHVEIEDMSGECRRHYLQDVATAASQLLGALGFAQNIRNRIIRVPSNSSIRWLWPSFQRDYRISIV